MKPTDISDPEYFHKVIDCQYACPAHTPVPEYIRLITRERYDDAYRLNWISNVFPGILGRVCDRPCEPACRRGRIEKEPVAICRLKRFAADSKENPISGKAYVMKEKNGKKVALIGGGPASLTVARDLAPRGYEIDLYDEQDKAGGFMRSQVPSFRLPEAVLDEEVGYIMEMGINHHIQRVDSLKSIIAKNYDAIFIATGAPKGRDLPDLAGRKEGEKNIHIGIDWLAGVVFGHQKKIGRRVLVLGGGNTAMDCCRTARRLGGEEVSIVVRSPRSTMKASPWEIEDALREDIPIIDNHVPKEFVIKEGKLVGMLFDRVRPEVNDQGKRVLISTGEEPVLLHCDDVLLAVGQQNAFPWIENDSGIYFNSYGLPELNPETLQSSIDNIFFGGDAAFGPKNIITAVAHGHQAAISIDLYLRGKDPARRPAPSVITQGQKIGLNDWMYDNEVSSDLRYSVPMADKTKSLKDRLLEVELGYDREVGLKEAHRCLNCDVQTVFDAPSCIECDSCVDICPVNCINFIENDSELAIRKKLSIPANNLEQSLYVSEPVHTGRIMVKDENVCLHCGLCAERCPTSSWEMVRFTYKSPVLIDKETGK